MDDLVPSPTPELVRLGLEAALLATETTLEELAARVVGLPDSQYLTVWPGEHYRYLAALARMRSVALAVEVGSFRGAGSLALMSAAQRTVTFDVVPWADIRGTWLTENDFAGALEQELGDLSEPETFDQHRQLLETADMIFIDGPKDGLFERRFVELLLEHVSPSGRLLVFDDIRVLTMLSFWRWLPLPKLDVTSLGHWSGTGLAIL